MHDEDVTSKLLLPLLDVAPEANLQREIKDIIDELEIIKHVLDQQRDVMDRFISIGRAMVSQDEALGIRTNSDLTQLKKKVEGKEAARAAKKAKDAATDTEDEDAGSRLETTGLRDLLDRIGTFDRRARTLKAKMTERRLEIDGLLQSAASTASNVNELLSLKQQQASVVQAYQANRQAEEAVLQGRSIMLFTVMTIIFVSRSICAHSVYHANRPKLPLSFMTSLFGMNAVELTGDATAALIPWQIQNFWPLAFKQQILIMCTSLSSSSVISLHTPLTRPQSPSPSAS